jgi:hypothetical protein
LKLRSEVICLQSKLAVTNRVELIQHVSQISILLQTLPRKDPSKAKQPIGFCPSAQEEK